MRFIVLKRAEVNCHDEKAFRFKADICSLCILHASNEQSCTNERDESKRDLGNDQDAAQRTASPSSASAPATGVERFGYFGPGCLDGRGQAEDDSGQQRKAEGKQQYVRIESEVEIIILDEGWTKSPEQAAAGEREHESDCTAGQR